MRAVVCRAFGPLNSLEVAELPPPVAGPRQVIVQVRAAGVNFPDALIVQGLHQVKPALPFTPGGELAGVVTAIGAGVDAALGFNLGAAVYGAPMRGAFAEEVAVDVDKLRLVPPGRSFEEAACVSTTYDTAYYALVTLAQIKAGEQVLVLGAAGGVGLAAIEIAKVHGAQVIAAASTDEKLSICQAHGADAVINYSREDLRTRLKELTAHRGVDVVYDPVGGAYAEVAMRRLAWRGRYLVVGFAAGEIPRLPLNLVLLKGAAVIGVFLGEAMARDPALAREIVDGVETLFRAGRIRPLIHGRCGFPQVAEALRALLERRVMGKLVLVP